MRRHLAITGFRLGVASVIAAAVGGCSLWGGDNPCASEEEYQAAQSVQAISVPAGLDRPSQAALLNIPDEPKPAEPLSRNAECLQFPPNYFDKPVSGSTN